MRNLEKFRNELFLPDDAVPPLDLNRELMLKWRKKMEDYYHEAE